MTGKPEILRMCKRLRGRFCKESNEKRGNNVDIWNESQENSKLNNQIRDMDDDDEDGDIFDEEDDDSETMDTEVLDHLDKKIENDTNHEMDVIVLPLFSMLSPKEQAKVFSSATYIDASKTRLIVVATNIAETSITIPNITYVVDTGRQKVRNYHPISGFTSYDVMWISKASADQRAGRAGARAPRRTEARSPAW